MRAEIKIRRQAGMPIRRLVLVDKLPLSVSVHYGLDSLSAIADFQDYTISIAAEARPILGHRSSASARRPISVILTWATSIARPPATTRSVRVVAIPVRMRSIDREPVREHDRLAAAVGRCGKQFERTAALGLRDAPAA
jgi:hypothetical protein